MLTRLYFHMQRLCERGVDPRSRELTEYLAGTIEQLWRRSSLSDRLWKRLPAVAMHWLSGDYSRYNHRVRDALSYDLKPKFFS